MTKIETFSLQDDDFALFRGKWYKLTDEECAHHDEVINWLLNSNTSKTDLNDLMAYNADIASVYGDNQWKLFQHFVNSGMKEGRQGSSEFNLAAYKANNPDLVAIFGDDNAKYYEHYISSGKAEGRKAV